MIQCSAQRRLSLAKISEIFRFVPAPSERFEIESDRNSDIILQRNVNKISQPRVANFTREGTKEEKDPPRNSHRIPLKRSPFISLPSLIYKKLSSDLFGNFPPVYAFPYRARSQYSKSLIMPMIINLSNQRIA